MPQIDYFSRKLDDKHRLGLPVEVRSEFVEGVVITRGFGKYLHAYPLSIWNSLVEPKLAGDILDEKIADLNVRFRIGKQVSTPDAKQGRILIDSALLVYADITSEVSAVRVGPYWRLGNPKHINN
jgi:MraZ protein